MCTTKIFIMLLLLRNTGPVNDLTLLLRSVCAYITEQVEKACASAAEKKQ